MFCPIVGMAASVFLTASTGQKYFLTLLNSAATAIISRVNPEIPDVTKAFTKSYSGSFALLLFSGQLSFSFSISTASTFKGQSLSLFIFCSYNLPAHLEEIHTTLAAEDKACSGRLTLISPSSHEKQQRNLSSSHPQKENYIQSLQQKTRPVLAISQSDFSFLQ